MERTCTTPTKCARERTEAAVPAGHPPVRTATPDHGEVIDGKRYLETGTGDTSGPGAAQD